MVAPEPIVEARSLAIAPLRAFALFTTDLSLWWPQAYSWSQGSLDRIWIDDHPAGLAREVDQAGLERIWGFVIDCDPPHRLAFRWMIDPDRALQRDPARASLVEIAIARDADADASRVTLTHGEFDRHPGDTAAYRAGLAADQGWPYLMDLLANAAA